MAMVQSHKKEIEESKRKKGQTKIRLPLSIELGEESRGVNNSIMEE